MSLNPNSSATSFSSDVPSSKLSLTINAFNGNTTNFNRRPSPKSVPVQPATNPRFGGLNSNLSAGMIRPM
jgi:hypothetical protein